MLCSVCCTEAQALQHVIAILLRVWSERADFENDPQSCVYAAPHVSHHPCEGWSGHSKVRHRISDGQAPAEFLM